MPSSTLLTLVSLLGFLQFAFAAPDGSHHAGQSVTLLRRQSLERTADDWGVWAQNQRQALEVKYGGTSPAKRSEGTNLMINQATDSSYIGSLAIGTPPNAFYVTLDTGSSDLWVTDANCATGCTRGATYNPSSSSTSQNVSQPFSAAYGSGQVAGYLVSDVVQMAGFSVKNQIFGSVTQLSSGFQTAPVTGLLGLGWQSISTTNQLPFWQTLASQGAWSQPLMGFQLTRFLNGSNAQPLEPGGSFTMGFVNTSLYTGDIDYRNLATTPSFWILSLQKLIVQGSSVSLPSGSASYAAIDTGTTLVGGPPSVIQNIYANIPNSVPGSGNWQNYWFYPCDTQVSVSMSFGGPAWPVSPADFQLAQVGPNQCVGAFFAVNTGGGAPNWIIGDTFLKNVYSVFRYSPASVGFAALSPEALAMNGANGPPPTATIGSVQTSVTATTGNSTTSAAGWSTSITFQPLVVACGVALGALLL